jgi:hypothetical protein
MKRVSAVLLFVALGAFATGIGVIPFLVLANQDRDALNTELRKTQAAAERAAEEKEQIANQANQKVLDANSEIQRAQAVLQGLQEDQRLTAIADQIPQPKPRDLARWTSVVSLTLGVQFSIPQGSYVDMDEKTGIAIARGSTTSSAVPFTRWIEVTPYNKDRRDTLDASLSSASPQTLLIHGRLFKGSLGTLNDDSRGMYLEARESGTSTHLIWIRDIDTLERKGILNTLLGSFVIQSPS